MPNNKTLREIHEDVPADHYDRGLKRNLFQKIWHKRRFSEVLSFIDPTDEAVLDVGCHSGTFTQKIIQKIKTKKVYGIDISPSAIEKISERIPYGTFKVADATEIPFKSNFFEAAVCLEVLEHVDYPLEVLKEIHRVLKKGGYGVILVPTDNRLFKFIWFLWTMYYPVWRHAHVQSFSNTTLESVIKKSGFKIVMVKYFNLGMLKLVKFVKV